MDSNNIRTILFNLFKKQLMIDFFDENTNFFDLGTNSIELSLLCSDLEKELNRPLSILLFYEYPTLYLLGNKLEEMCNGTL